MKKFSVTCDFGGQPSPFAIYVGVPEGTHHPAHFQADWLSKNRGGNVPGEFMEAVSQLQEIAAKNKVSLEELCVYALGAAQQEKEDGESLSDIETYDDSVEDEDLEDLFDFDDMVSDVDEEGVPLSAEDLVEIEKLRKDEEISDEDFEKLMADAKSGNLDDSGEIIPPEADDEFDLDDFDLSSEDLDKLSDYNIDDEELEDILEEIDKNQSSDK